jgi:PTS system fructose-specific IIC component
VKISNIFSEDFIRIDLEASSKMEAIDMLSDLFVENGVVSDKEQFINDVALREEEMSTELEHGVAMPHARSSSVQKPAVAIGISKKGIVFGDSNQLSHIVVLIAMPLDATSEHIQVLAHVTSSILDADRIDALNNAKTKKEVLSVFEERQDTEEVVDSKRFLIGATGCASGVAHTYLAQKALVKAANEQGVSIKVETNGSIGVENSPTSEEIEQAEAVIIASDKAVDMERFEGKKIIYASAKEGINHSSQLIDDALNGKGEIYRGKEMKEKKDTSKAKGVKIYKALMNGVSYMIPFVVVGGLMIAISYAIGGEVTDGGLVIPPDSLWQKIADIGSVGMTLMIPILGGYVAYAIGDRPALAPGMIGGWIAANGSFYNAESGAGFIGAIAAGFIAGYVVLGIKKIKFPESIQALVPIVIIPIVATLIVGFAFIFIIGAPISSLMDGLYDMLQNMSGGNLILLGIVMGLMQGFDMGGPFGKTLLMFSIALMAEGQNQFMGAQAMAIPVAPLGMAIATFVDRRGKFFDKEEKASGKAALVMGLCGISEGAIPFAAADPIAVIPANMIGSAVAAV